MIQSIPKRCFISVDCDPVPSPSPCPNSQDSSSNLFPGFCSYSAPFFTQRSAFILWIGKEILSFLCLISSKGSSCLQDTNQTLNIAQVALQDLLQFPFQNTLSLGHLAPVTPIFLYILQSIQISSRLRLLNLLFLNLEHSSSNFSAIWVIHVTSAIMDIYWTILNSA